MMHSWFRLSLRSPMLAVLLAAATAALSISVRGAAGPSSEWRAYGANNGNLKYAPLDQINKENIRDLRIAWRQSAMPAAVRKDRAAVAVPTNYQVTPLMAGGLLYASAGDGSVMALNPRTGSVAWSYVPDDFLKATAAGDGQPGERVGGRSANRGVAYWSGDGSGARVIAISGRSLVALDAKTGVLVGAFGTGGRIDLTMGYRVPAASYQWTSVPLVTNNLIVIGGTARAADGQYLPGDIRAYDARTGKPAWTFKVIPEFGEFGQDTWQRDSYAYSGAAGLWGFLGADDELGYVYLATETPSSRGGDFWGGERPGSNLFAESLVCIDSRTGKRVWHFQAVHHGIWDYDFNAPPNLIDITVDGRRIKAIAEVSKQAFVYVLDRVTGKPVWPIEERPVPTGDLPGEWYAPTQPFPTRPPAFDQQGVTVDDLIDFTPDLRKQAIDILGRYRYGPIFTPPSAANAASGTKGTVQMPGAAGGANWTGAAADPETGVLYVTSTHSPFVAEMISARDPEATRGNAPSGESFGLVEWATRRGDAVTGPWLEGPQGLPIFKPPYGRLVAIDLNKGEIRWSVANGDGPRNHPAIKHLNVPRLGQGGRAAPLVTKTMVFLGEGGNDAVVALPPFGGGKMFRAYDKTTGAVLWEMELPAGTTGAPMSYLFEGKQYIVVATGWKDTPGELIALALPEQASQPQGNQPPPRRVLPQVTQEFVSVQAPVVVLQHVRVIDGTGAAAVSDQTIVIEGGVIKAIGPAASTSVPAGARVLDMTGKTALPGWVAMHEHLFYPGPTGVGRIPDVPEYYPTMVYTFPRMYLAGGVTSMRTAGSMSPYADLETKRYIDAGRIPGPKMHLTGPYLQGPGAYLVQLHSLSSPEEATKMVNYWADVGFTSFKAYTQITRAQLGAAIRAAHARGLKVTGHLCSVTFREAADLGIDSLEHGISASTDFVPGKEPDVCPSRVGPEGTPDVTSPQVQELIRYLVSKKVAIVSTLPVAEAGVPGRPPLRDGFLELLTPMARTDYLIARARTDESARPRLKRSMDFEVAFVRAGGTLLGGLDPTGNGGAIPGFGDQREVELLVEAGFTPLEAIKIQTQNGAEFLGESARVGTLKVGKQADINVVTGDPSVRIADIENVDVVFKDGVGFDPRKLWESVKGLVGSR